MIPGMSGRLGSGTANTCGCELGWDALTMMPPLAVDDDDPSPPKIIDPSSPPDDSLALDDTNAFFTLFSPILPADVVPNSSKSAREENARAARPPRPSPPLVIHLASARTLAVAVTDVIDDDDDDSRATLERHARAHSRRTARAALDMSTSMQSKSKVKSIHRQSLTTTNTTNTTNATSVSRSTGRPSASGPTRVASVSDATSE
tara:strand:+ start:2731 stop:3342 length:612 start_codon:yes stop_codon:yes gene_type:complete